MHSDTVKCSFRLSAVDLNFVEICCVGVMYSGE